MIPAREPLPGRTKIEIRGVHMAFRTEDNDVRVLEDIDLDVREGEFVCILGPSGCGKSTLLNIVAGFLAPTAGSVRIDGEEVRGPDPRRIFVFQERGVFPWLTVEGNIGFGLGKLPRDGARAPHRALRPARRSRGLREGLPARALGRHEAARRGGPRASP